jgi:two-component system C4-dicarboxylate transport sensor histidine kinase DctB
MLVLSRTLNGMDWRLMTLSDLSAVHRRAILHSIMAAVTAAFLVLLALYVSQRRRILRQKHEARLLLERANAELEQSVARRTADLTDANARLRREIGERERAEETLREAQSERVHTAKLAVLGQLATGITHELTQPLGAIRTLSGNASEYLRRGDLEALGGNLEIIARMADQMGRIIQPLKRFGRKSVPNATHCDVAHVIGNALALYRARFDKEGVEVVNDCEPGGFAVWCDPSRLEQVLINLVGNALDAMSACAQKRLTVAVTADGRAGVRIDVLDTGAGLGEEASRRLFEPFFTTKPQGAGLGLGLPISRDIVREFHGDIDAANRPEGGARFSLLLPGAPESAVA